MLYIVRHIGVYPAILAYFEGIPDDNKMLRKRTKNCEVVKFGESKSVS